MHFVCRTNGQIPKHQCHDQTQPMRAILHMSSVLVRLTYGSTDESKGLNCSLYGPRNADCTADGRNNICWRRPDGLEPRDHGLS